MEEEVEELALRLPYPVDRRYIVGLADREVDKEAEKATDKRTVVATASRWALRKAVVMSNSLIDSSDAELSTTELGREWRGSVGDGVEGGEWSRRR
jgi:hypothetical protein